MENQRKTYEKKLYAQIQEWSVDIALLTAKASSARADVKIVHFKAIEALEARQDEVRVKLLESMAAGDRARIDLNRGVEQAWPEVQAA